MTNIVPEFLDSEDIERLSSCNFLFQLKGRRILVTGGTGMVGSYMLEAICFGMQRLGIAPKEIRIFSGSLRYESIEHLGRFEFIKFHNVPLLEIDAQKNYDFLIHAASPASPTKLPSFEVLKSVNSEILEKLITVGMENVLFISSGEVYGPRAQVPFLESTQIELSENNSRFEYPQSKIMGEIRGNELCNAVSAKFNVARLFHSFGPGMRENDGRSFPDFIWRAARLELPVLRSSGKDVRTFLYLRDTVIAFFQILEKGESNGIYNVGSSHPLSILDCAKKISSLANLDGEVLFQDVQGDYIHSPIHSIIPSVDKLNQIGWRQEVDLDKMIVRTLKWARQRI